jgi:ornithine decarboxylase
MRGLLLPAPADCVESAYDTAVYGVDLGMVVDRYVQFLDALPRVTPYFAVKCNPDPVVVRLLALLGAHFDCASTSEIALVASAGNVPVADLDARVVYANPCKQGSHLSYAAVRGIRLMTFDCEDELLKIADLHPGARLLLRIAVEDSTALCPLSSKYGASMHDVPVLLAAVARLRLDLVGVAFHVGSGCTTVSAYVDALHNARAVFNTAAMAGLPPLTVLDIGGGFPGYDGEAPVTFCDIAATVRVTVEELFPASEGVNVMAEPGRYFVASAFCLATQVLSRRFPASPAAVVIGDGVYGSFKDAVLLNIQFSPRQILSSTDHSNTERDVVPTTLYGPTCDARDVVARDVRLPSALSVGDWLFFVNMGAYTMSLATSFSGFARPRNHYYIAEISPLLGTDV